jgi:hypothetical protein
VKGVDKGRVMKADDFAQAVQILLYAPIKIHVIDLLNRS